MIARPFVPSFLSEPLEPRRLLAAGDADSSFGAAGMIDLGRRVQGSPSTVIPLAGDQFLLMAMSAPQQGYAPRAQVERHNTDGSLDRTFGVNGIYDQNLPDIIDARLAPDGKIVLASWGMSDPKFTRLTADGQLDTTFGVDGVAHLRDLVGDDHGYYHDFSMADDGGIVVVSLQGQVYRLNAQGQVDSSFTPFLFTPNNGSLLGAGVAVAPEGKVIVAGVNLQHAGRYFEFVRLTSTGVVDPTFADAGYYDGFNPSGFAVQEDGQILVAWQGESRTTLHVQRLTADGELDTTFHAVMPFGKLKGVTTFRFDDQGHIIVHNNNSLARLGSNGSVDETFARVTTYYWAGSLYVCGVAVQSDGDLLVAAAPGTNSPSGNGRLYRLHGDDAPESAFVEVEDGKLSVTGTTANDAYAVQGQGSAVMVGAVNAFGRVFDAADITAIEASLGGGNDQLVIAGVSAPATVAGDAGNDWIIFETETSATVSGGDGDDTIHGTAAADSISGDSGFDYLVGGAGDDSIWGGANRDYLLGALGNDQLFGGGSNDHLFGGEGVDSLHGNAGFDHFRTFADGSVDHLFGDGGLDWASCDEDDVRQSIESLA